MANDLHDYLVEQIKIQGPMTLGKFIENAMTHPQFGYYSSESIYPIGKQGDFITAPEVSQMFGEMIGAWVIDLWRQMGGCEITLLECGPGRGALMADILRVAHKIPEFTQRVNVKFVETSKSLREAQKSVVQEYIDLERVSWSTSLCEQENACIIIGNEFLDALPIEQVIRRNGAWYQRTIEQEGDSFCFGDQIVDETLEPFLPNHAQDNEVYEISPARIGFIRSCLRIMDKSSGVALLIDYGYNKTHFGDTLQSVKNHTYARVLDDVGESDITSHVDFEPLIKTVRDHGGYCEQIISQGKFLKVLGIECRARALKTSAEDKSQDIDMALDRLVGPTQMGDLFKVMCFHSEKSGSTIKPSGF